MCFTRFIFLCRIFYCSILLICDSIAHIFVLTSVVLIELYTIYYASTSENSSQKGNVEHAPHFLFRIFSPTFISLFLLHFLAY